MKLLWKAKLDVQTRQLHALFPPLVAGSVATSSGAKEIAVVAVVSDTLYGIDVEAGTVIWSKHFDSTFKEPPPTGRGGGSTLCPGGLTATPVLDQPSPGNTLRMPCPGTGGCARSTSPRAMRLSPRCSFRPTASLTG